MRFDRGHISARVGACALLLLTGCATTAPSGERSDQAAPSALEPQPVEAGIPSLPGEYDTGIDVQHQDIELSLGQQQILGRTSITLEANGAVTLPLDFTGLAIDRVVVDGTVSDFEYENGKLSVPLPNSRRSVVDIDYSGTPDDGLIIRDNVHGDPTAFVDNWPNRTRFWVPTVDHPADKITASFTVHAPTEWEVIANGRQMGPPTPTTSDAIGGATDRRTWRWEATVPHPTYTLVVGAASFVIESLGRAACGNAPASVEEDGCVDVSFWVYPQDVAFARQVFRRAPDMVDYFTRTIGPFPFEKMANVQSATRFGGMENSSAIFYSEQAIAQGQLSEGTVSHEIAHQWFGNSATESDWNELWLSEGFATYFGALYFEEADGIEDFAGRMENNRQSYLASNVTSRPIVDPDGAPNLFMLLNANNYQKGGWVLHMLRGVVGDQAFFNGIRAYYGAYEYGNATTEDLRRVMETASGEPLAWFFDQWLREPGFPTLESEWTWSEEEDVVSLTIRQTQAADWPTFRLPMEIEVETGGRSESRRVELTEREATFRFPAEARPDRVTVDPNGWVLKG